MFVRVVTVATTLLVAWPALAEPLGVDAARRFVVGKTFAYNCFDGTRGAGRIQQRPLGRRHHPDSRHRTGTLRAAAARHAEGQGPGGLRLRARHPDGAVLQRRPHRPAKLPRLGRRAAVRLLRFHPSRPAPAVGGAHGASHLAAAGDPCGRGGRDCPLPIQIHPLCTAPVSGAVAFRAGNSRRW